VNQPCILCSLRSGSIPVTRVFEDELVSVVMDIRPVNAGHMLVFPKTCVQLVTELDDETAAHLFRVAKRMNAALRSSGLPCEAVNFFLADGESAGQEISHVHLHVFPRFTGDGFGLRMPSGYNSLPSRQQLIDAAAAISSRL